MTISRGLWEGGSAGGKFLNGVSGGDFTNIDKALDYACGDGVGWAVYPIILWRHCVGDLYISNIT